MKIEKKDIIFWILIAGVAVTVGVILTSNKSNETSSFLPTTSPTPTASPTPTPVVSTTAKTPGPTPNLKIQEVNSYEYLFSHMDPQNQVLGIYSECNLIIPSNVTYKNNTRVMLDNTRSDQDHVLKIGTKDYSLKAKDWTLVTLSSATLPADLPIFCNNIELGSIRLE